MTKRILIVETAKISTSTSIAHVRNAVKLQKYLSLYSQCDIVDLSDTIDTTKQYDIILFSYATARADYSSIEKLVSNQKNVKIGWITNEFELFANDYVKKNMTFMITNFEESGIKKAHRHDQLLMTNLNTLIMRKRNKSVDKKYDVCYYGTYRKYRLDYFKKYFINDMILSTSKKNWKNFIDVDATCKVTDKLSWATEKETLNLFKGSLYIEDTKTHECFNYMANRFFEGLYCNVPLFFDVSCKNTIDKDIYEIDDYFIIDGYDDLMSKINNLDMDRVERYLSVNSEIALEEKRKTLESIRNFLLEL